MATEASETGSLIGSDKVEGTAVYGADDNKIGSIERVMIDKISGKVSYAVLSFGGFLGIGDDHYPLPWQSLKYDTDLGGYHTGITESSSRARRNTATTMAGTGRRGTRPRRQRLLRRRNAVNDRGCDRVSKGPPRRAFSFQQTTLRLERLYIARQSITPQKVWRSDP